MVEVTASKTMVSILDGDDNVSTYLSQKFTCYSNLFGSENVNVYDGTIQFGGTTVCSNICSTHTHLNMLHRCARSSHTELRAAVQSRSIEIMIEIFCGQWNIIYFC